MGGPIQVRVKDIGDGQFVYYDDKRRRPGDVFFIKNELDFSKKTMERVDEHPEATKNPAKQITGDPKTRLPVEQRLAQKRAKVAASQQGAIAEDAKSNSSGSAEEV